MALFELDQKYKEEETKWTAPTFKDCIASDIETVFFNTDELTDIHTVDGKTVPCVIEVSRLQEHSAHWEAGAKQNFDTGLYTAHTILYIKIADYGPRPKVGRQLVMDQGTKEQRTFTILKCEDEAGIYRITMERTRQ